MAKAKDQPEKHEPGQQQKLPLLWNDAAAKKTDADATAVPAASGDAQPAEQRTKTPAEDAPPWDTGESLPRPRNAEPQDAGKEQQDPDAAAARPGPSTPTAENQAETAELTPGRTPGRNPKGVSAGKTPRLDPGTGDSDPPAPGRDTPEHAAADNPLHHPTDLVEPHVVQLKHAVESVGQQLMQARAEAGLTLEQVAANTQIRKSVIEDLENDVYDRLPVAFYCVSHIEALCKEYKIDATPIVAQFRHVAEPLDEKAGPDRFSVTSFDSESGSKVTYTPSAAAVMGGSKKRPTSLTGVIVSALILLLAGLAIGAWAVQQWRTRSTPTTNDSALIPEARELSEFIVPQQLPLESMPIPTD